MKQLAPYNSTDPTDYGTYRDGVYYEGVAFVQSHRRALWLARQCRRMGARCTVLVRHWREVLAMPADAPDAAVAYAERGG